jgi:hypothetical protein
MRAASTTINIKITKSIFCTNKVPNYIDFLQKKIIQNLKPAPLLKHHAKNTRGRMEALLHEYLTLEPDKGELVNLHAVHLYHHTTLGTRWDSQLRGSQTHYKHVNTKEVSAPAWYRVPAP